MTRVAVTGGAGFIGRNICASLCADPRVDEVCVLDDLSGPNPYVMPGTRFVEGSVLDPHALRTALHGARAVVHLAARSTVADGLSDPLRTARVNSLGTATVLEAARRCGVQTAVIISSAAVYGDGHRAPIPESAPPRPAHPYGASKVAAEAYALAWQETFGLRASVLRLFNVYGPGQRASGPSAGVVARFVDAALNGRPLVLNGGGSQRRDFVYVGDVARIVRGVVLDRVECPRPVNVGSGIATPVRELARTLESVLGRRLDRIDGPALAEDVSYSAASVHRLRSVFPGLVMTSLADGLAATLTWALADQQADQQAAPLVAAPVGSQS